MSVWWIAQLSWAISTLPTSLLIGMEKTSTQRMRRTLPICESHSSGIQATVEGSRRGDSLTDQIEFANVILLNKTDMVDEPTVKKVTELVKTLNP